MLEKVTVEERRTPAGTGIGLVISEIFPKGWNVWDQSTINGEQGTYS
jgi:hypothetical protein